MKYLVLGLLLFISSCDFFKLDIKYSPKSSTSTIIRGRVAFLSGLISYQPSSFPFIKEAWAADCTATVHLLKLNTLGQIETTSLAEANLKSDTSFELLVENFAVTSYPQYVLEVQTSGGLPQCARVYHRPVMGDLKQQDITYGSHLLAGIESKLDYNLTQIDSKRLDSLVRALPTTSELAAFNALDTQAALRDEFYSLFGFTPARLKNSAPSISSTTIFPLMAEKVAREFKAEIYHWDPTYQAAFVWKLDGQAVSTSSVWTYLPTADNDGSHVVELLIGKDDGSGAIDLSLPYSRKIYQVIVTNNIPATPPQISVSSALSGNILTQVSINTGSGKANCESFTSMALTVNDLNIPTTFPLTCSAAGAQIETINLISDGPKVIRLWVVDTNGRVSAGPSIMTMSLDTSFPLANILIGASKIKGGSTASITYSATDANSVRSVKLLYAADGVTYSEVADLSLTGTNYTWAVPADNTSSATLKLRVEDGALNVSETTTSTFEIDSAAPVLGTFALISASPTSSQNALLSLSSCAGVNYVLLNQGTTPTESTSGWVACSTAMTYALPDTTQGTRIISLWAKDNVGNISTSKSVGLVYDSVAPSAPTITRTSPSPTNSLNLTFTTASCTDTSHILINTGSRPLDSDGAWQTCSTSTSYSTTIATGDGPKTFSVWAKDLTGNVSATSTSLSTVLDGTPPTLNSVIINASTDNPLGEAITGLPLVNISVNVTDKDSGTMVLISNADNSNNCSILTGDWQNHTGGINGSSQIYNIYLNATDGTKKVCVWAKDSLGNTSQISPASGTLGVNMDTIIFETGNIPQIESFSVTNTTSTDSTLIGTTKFLVGDTARISWTVTDVEGLSNSPITLEMTTDNTTWTPILSEYGSLSGNPTSFTGSYNYTATRAYNSASVTNRYFRIRVRVKDKTGNTSVAVLSQALNLNNWSIFAGSNDRGLGGTAKSASLSAYGLGKKAFAVHPLTNDIYAYDLDGSSIVKISASTGLVSPFMKISTSTNLSATGGALPATPTIATANANAPFTFDNNGLLYIMHFKSGSQGVLYQIDLASNTSRAYVGNGSEIAEGTLANQMNFNSASAFVFDAYNNLYFFATCNPSISMGWTSNGGIAATNSIKLMKAPQINTNGIYTGGATTHLAGNCVRANPIYGIDARQSPIYADQALYNKLSVNDDGSQIYIIPSAIPGAFYKIINGIIYSTATMSSYDIAYNRSNGKFYTHNNGQIYEFSGVNGNGGEIYSTYMGTSSTVGDCAADGILHSVACLQTSNHMEFTKDGTLLIADGLKGTTSTKFRIRYKDENGLMRTLAGVMSFNGDGLKKELINGTFASIHYKKSTDPNLGTTPEGLYFLSTDSLLYGRIEASTHATKPNKATFLWGNQIVGANTQKADGSTISTSESIYTLLNMKFDTEGYPWIFYNATSITKIVGDISYRKLRATASTYWDSNGATPSNSGFLSNSGSWVPYTNDIVLGVGKSCTTTVVNGGTCPQASQSISKVRNINIGANTITTLFGGASNAWTNDILTYGGLSSMTFHIDTGLARVEPATASAPVKLYYVENLYYIRCIEDPFNAANSRLKTIAYIPNLYAYTLNPSGGLYPAQSMVFAIKGISTSLQLFCYPNPDVAGAPTWCNGTSLGPNGPTVDLPYLSTLSYSNTNMTWKDGNTLIIGSDSLIYQFEVK